MSKFVAVKISIKQNMRAIIINAPADANQLIDTSSIELEKILSGNFDYIHLFVKNQEEFHEKFPPLKSHLKRTGMLWVSWSKSGQKNTDLNMKSVIKLGYDYGLVESKCISINSIWSALKFTHSKNGKPIITAMENLKGRLYRTSIDEWNYENERVF